MREEKVGLLIPHFSFQRFNHTGGLAFHPGVKCLIFLLVSFFFLHNECKSKNVNKAFPHHTHALRPPPASYACSDLPASFLRTLRPSFASYRFCRSAAPFALPRASAGARVSGRQQPRKPSGPPPLPPRLPSPPPQPSPPPPSPPPPTAQRGPSGPSSQGLCKAQHRDPDFYAPWKG